MDGQIPALLTVEEAAKLLRIGRTKAYALTREWRATGGKSGLPVVDFGSVLRVPRAQLEGLIGGTLTPLVVVEKPAPATQVAPRSPSPATKPSRARPRVDVDQPTLFAS